MKPPVNTINKFKKAINDNRFTIDVELEMIIHLVNKYNFMSVSQYARSKSISQPAALKRVKSGKVMFIEMIGRKFIIN
tara:strand:+ start:457 stop:690 length:234 start_codon:yes stop_codon:yes gene_type:complete